MASTPPSSTDGTVKADNDGCKAGGGATLCSCIISLGNKNEKSTVSLCDICEDDVIDGRGCDGGGVITRGGAAIEGGAAIGGGETIGDGTEIGAWAISAGCARLLSIESRQNDTFFLIGCSC